MNATKVALVFALALITPSVSAQYELFMKLDAILGDAEEKFHKNWIQLSEFTLSAGALDPNTEVFNFRFSYRIDRSFVPMLDAQRAQTNFLKMDVHTVNTSSATGTVVNALVLRNLQLGPLTLSSDEEGLLASASVIGLDSLEVTYTYIDPQSITGVGRQVTFIDYANGTSSTALLSALEGDYNADGEIALDDYSAWASLYGSDSLVADGNRNGAVDAADYTIWRDQMAAAEVGGSGASQAAPEPSATAILAVLAMPILLRRRVARVARAN